MVAAIYTPKFKWALWAQFLSHTLQILEINLSFEALKMATSSPSIYRDLQALSLVYYHHHLFVCFDMFTAKELAENSHVQDAFVIAVEQQAKERLERLSALRRIKPVDMTKLSQQVQLLLYYLLDIMYLVVTTLVYTWTTVHN